MSEHLFLYRIKDSDDRDCCAYTDAAGPKFECNHYFSSINVCGSCYSGSEFPVYEKIETILKKDEYEEILTFNIFIKALGYGITKGDSRYRAGIKLINSIKHLYDKLKSDEAFAFFENIQKSEMEYLKEEYNLSDRNIEEIFNEYAEDFRDMIKIIMSIVMSARFVKDILLNMTSGAKRIVITIDIRVNGNMMIKKG